MPLIRSPAQRTILRRVSTRSSATSSIPAAKPRFNVAAAASLGVLGAGLVVYELRWRKSNKGQSAANDSSIPSLDLKLGQQLGPPLVPTPAQVTSMLNHDAWAVTNTETPGVARYHGVQVPSNAKCEDRYVHGRFPAPVSDGGKAAKDWLAWGVFDGHIGAQTAELLSHQLVPFVYRHLKGLATKPLEGGIEQAIKNAFLALDDTFIAPAQETMADASLGLAEKVARLTPGANGSCALLSLFDPATQTLRVACTGDSRAVLGWRDPSAGGGQWKTLALSEDQSGSSDAEIARLNALHPNEPGMVQGGRVLGLMCSRAFGDAHWKWPAEVCAEAKARYNADAMRPIAKELYLTPPYITAEPDVTTTKLQLNEAGKSKHGPSGFMIMATDGLWDNMTSERAVELVAKWLEWEQAGKPAPQPLAKEVLDEFKNYDMEKRARDGVHGSRQELTVQDDNVAVHLTRNALGGANHHMLSAMLLYQSPYSRNVRDDITVQVVFFD